MSSAPTISYVELGSTGHRPVWVRAITDAFLELRPPCRLNVWLPQDFRDLHREWAERHFDKLAATRSPVRFQCYKTQSPGSPNDGADQTSARDTILACAQEDRSAVCFIANNLDAQIRAIAQGDFRSMGARLVGIMDQPFLHYCGFKYHQNREWLPKRRYFTAFLWNFIAIRRSTVRRVLLLDPLASKFYGRWLCSNKYRYLPESFTHRESSATSRSGTAAGPERVRLLFIGPVTRRKGIFELLAGAELLLARDPALCSHVAVVIAGRVPEEMKAELCARLSRLQRLFPDASFTLRDELLPPDVFCDYFKSANVVCIPYIRFFGTSGLLVEAAQANRVVLAPEFGLIGELVRRYRLGVTCDTSSPASISTGLGCAIRMHRDRGPSLQSGRERFVRECAVPLQEFGRRVVQNLSEVLAEEAGTS